MEPRKHAIVTGAASGLGRAIAVDLARKGWCVAVADVDDVGSQETLALVHAAGGQGQVEHLDVTNSAEWRALRDKLQMAWPNLDLLVNNAGVAISGEVGKLTLDDWHWIVNVNLYGAVYGCHTLVDWLKCNPRGAHIVNIASAAAIVAAPAMAPYNVTKAGILALSETLYGELKPYNIGVTGVCPAFFHTNILNNARFESQERRAMAMRLMNRSRATADDVAKRVMRAIARKQPYVFVPAIAGMYWRLKRLMPRTWLKIVAYGYRRETAAAAKMVADQTPSLSVEKAGPDGPHHRRRERTLTPQQPTTTLPLDRDRDTL
jgi:NAD(P)-dependent dehydrogenase (short-subunit alcohol dehydrogenase family)